MNIRERFPRLASAAGLAAAMLLAASPAVQASDGKYGEEDAGKGGPHFQNVIVMVPDGCSQSIQTLARWYKKHVLKDDESLTLDSMVSGMVQTHMANSVITGSAAAATAFATGYKTTVRFLAVAPDPNEAANLTGYEDPIDNPYQPLATVLEASRLAGMATGLVSTSRITHATPAAYACHIDDRGCDDEIMEHLVYQGLDVVFGGGERHLIPTGETYEGCGGKREDGDDLIEVLDELGYQMPRTAAELDDLDSGKAWGMFACSHMAPDLDRDKSESGQPSIAEMTEAAIELLSKDPDGFFLMVEGSQVDWAGHANDPIYMVTDFLAFDEAVAVAVEFAEQKRKGNTLVLVFPDHNTGALSIGSGTAIPPYTNTTVEDLLEPLVTMEYTSNVVEAEIKELSDDPDNPEAEVVQDVIAAIWGIEISEEEAEEILELSQEMYLSYAVSEVVSRYHTVFGWTTHGHTGEDVPLWSYATGGKPRPVGLFDNTELAGIVEDALRLDLASAQEELFVEVVPDDVTSTDPVDNPEITYGDCTLYVGTNLADGPVSDLPGLVVQAPSGCDEVPEGTVTSYYVPRKAVDACE